MSMMDAVAVEAETMNQPEEADGSGHGAGHEAGQQSGHGTRGPHERWIQIGEAILLAVITVVTAWSGFHGARWESYAKLTLSKSTAFQQKANDAFTAAAENRALDASNFQVWFTAYTQHDLPAADVAVRRFRAEFKVAFGAWLATNPFTSPTAPPGPLSMPEYSLPNMDKAEWLQARSNTLQHVGNDAGAYGDEYVRLTLMLAGVLFLVAISGQFTLVGARYGLLAVGGLGLLAIVGILITLPLSR